MLQGDRPHGDDGSGVELGLSAGGHLACMDAAVLSRPTYPPIAFVTGATVNLRGERYMKESATYAILDQAGWHMTDKLDVPENISIIALPPKYPELNPVENVWQFMPDNWLSNRVFTWLCYTTPDVADVGFISDYYATRMVLGVPIWEKRLRIAARTLSSVI